ncbi:MFS transporter [Pseudomonas matsuisoli]|uniref:MFS transporter n=1 Tax=Pseudomonas matsuisoli TaxID=1515666 RepID=A0A917PXZ0_9PSED|nr:MFS transporter [Pseudomonas matsuisoli]GGJ98596.1 MFS transporter [Pseudomonas matsuisoli]
MNASLGPLVITLAIQALVSMASFTLPVLAPEAARSIGSSASLVGLYVALIYLAAMISSLLSGRWIPRLGAIRVSQICLLSAAAGLAFAAIGTLPTMAISAVLLGAGYGPVTPASSHILARTTPANRMGFMFSLKQTGVPLGGVLAGALVPSLVNGFGWQGAVLVVGLACVVMAGIAQTTRADLDSDRRPDFRATNNPFQPLALIFAHPSIRNLALCSFVFGAMQLCLTTYLVTYLTHSYGLALVTAGLVLSLAQGGGMVGRLLWGWVGDRWLAPRRLLPLLAMAMALSSLATAAFTPSWPLAIVVLVSIFFGATAIGWNGIYLAEVARLAPAGSAGQYTGGTLFFTYFGVVAGPPTFALLTESSGSLALGYGVFGALLLVIGLMLARIAMRPVAPN